MALMTSLLHKVISIYDPAFLDIFFLCPFSVSGLYEELLVTLICSPRSPC